MDLFCYLLGLYVFVILGRIVLSWFPINPDGSLAVVHGFLHLLTDPILTPLSRYLPVVRLGAVGLDLAPLVAIVGVQILRGVICNT